MSCAPLGHWARIPIVNNRFLAVRNGNLRGQYADKVGSSRYQEPDSNRPVNTHIVALRIHIFHGLFLTPAKKEEVCVFLHTCCRGVAPTGCLWLSCHLAKYP